MFVAHAPANGVVTLYLYCPERSCLDEIPARFPVIDGTTREPVDGEIVRVSGVGETTSLIAWKPNQPLVEARSYEIEWRPSPALPRAESHTYSFEALAPLTWTASDLDLEIVLTAVTHGSETVSCPPVSDSCVRPTIEVATVNRTEIGFEVYVSDDSEQRGFSHQFEVRTAYWQDDAPAPELSAAVWPLGDPSSQGIFDVGSDRYCYRVEVHGLIDGSTALHEDCVEHGARDKVGTFPMPADQLAGELTRCKEAPDDFEQEWCQAWQAECERDSSACQRAAACTEEADEGQATSGESERPPASAGSGGCSALAVDGSRSSGAAWLALACGSLALALRVRRRRAVGTAVNR